ncbi:MAG TPA: ATP phosphoribosyltransferase [Clostridiales bacterium]|nr:ATP phosphoribosyltransferase [Clostridiales bacterium]
MTKLTIALPKGRLSKKALELIEKCGISLPESLDDRKLIAYDKNNEYRFLYVKPADVPTYVERGTADIGIAGKDTIMEEGKDIYELLDLKIGKCKLCIAGKSPEIMRDVYSLRVATKYPNIARQYFETKYISPDIIELKGSVELAPITDLSDVILDIVESGATLRSNGLKVLEVVADISARLIANKVSFKTKYDIINPLIQSLEQLVGAL